MLFKEILKQLKQNRDITMTIADDVTAGNTLLNTINTKLDGIVNQLQNLPAGSNTSGIVTQLTQIQDDIGDHTNDPTATPAPTPSASPAPSATPAPAGS